ncbi:hypothetical protein MicloDRAFT_00007420 [Microvirga lotononidis]|uniref:Uncharacterized protein n=1 Tax=Microvirga lotononidis TaxID=864069 RepID=I4Z2Q0_9HYPH|nr:hypothetical protein MicloDRAFT_00007420 [Microvirga lotononidis]
MSFPAEAQRRERESIARRQIVDPLPALHAPGMTPTHVMAGLVPAIPRV